MFENYWLELISDVDMYLMIEEGLRGGMSAISHRKAEANNKFMHSYNPGKTSKYITYLDANSLYSSSVIQCHIVVSNGSIREVSI